MFDKSLFNTFSLSAVIHFFNTLMFYFFQYAILLTMVVTTIMKYALHTIDLNRANPWENKTVYLLYTELVTGMKAHSYPPGSLTIQIIGFI